MSRLGQDSAHHADRAPGIVPDINDPTAGQVALGIVGDAIEGYGCPAMSPVAEAATPEVDPQQVIDQVFDFAEKMLAVQREFAKSPGRRAGSATQVACQQSESAVGAVRQQAEDTTKAVRGATKTDK